MSHTIAFNEQPTTAISFGAAILARQGLSPSISNKQTYITSPYMYGRTSKSIKYNCPITVYSMCGLHSIVDINHQFVLLLLLLFLNGRMMIDSFMWSNRCFNFCFRRVLFERYRFAIGKTVLMFWNRSMVWWWHRNIVTSLFFIVFFFFLSCRFVVELVLETRCDIVHYAKRFQFNRLIVML